MALFVLRICVSYKHWIILLSYKHWIMINFSQFVMQYSSGDWSHKHPENRLKHLKKEKPRFRGFCVLLERETRLELATPTLARLCSTNWAILAWSLILQSWCKNTSIILFHQVESKKKKKRQSCKPGSVLRLPWASIIDLGCYSRNTSIGLPS